MFVQKLKCFIIRWVIIGVLFVQNPWWMSLDFVIGHLCCITMVYGRSSSINQQLRLQGWIGSPIPSGQAAMAKARPCTLPNFCWDPGKGRWNISTILFVLQLQLVSCLRAAFCKWAWPKSTKSEGYQNGGPFCTVKPGELLEHCLDCLHPVHRSRTYLS